MLKFPEIDIVGDIMAEVAEIEVLPRFKNLSIGDINTKSSADDLVTTADVAAETRLTDALSKLMTGSLVVGEEAAFKDPNVLEYLKSEDAPVWVIDPVDGTMNFSSGYSEFGMVVALVYKGETVSGWLYKPTTKGMILGEKGSGAFFKGKDYRKQLHVSKVEDLSKMIGAVGRNVGFKDKNLVEPLYWGSAAYNYMLIISGNADYSAYRTKTIKPWDHCAGILLHEEAGGYTAFIDGGKYQPLMDVRNIISAPNKEAWEYLAKNLYAGTGKIKRGNLL
ncbi:MAG: inositol monophosphatase [Alphaproteobacteria bacterium]|nr:inositol monophosphatase [Alphaproteobacteria bacterium]